MAQASSPQPKSMVDISKSLLMDGLPQRSPFVPQTLQDLKTAHKQEIRPRKVSQDSCFEDRLSGQSSGVAWRKTQRRSSLSLVTAAINGVAIESDPFCDGSVQEYTRSGDGKSNREFPVVETLNKSNSHQNLMGAVMYRRSRDSRLQIMPNWEQKDGLGSQLADMELQRAALMDNLDGQREVNMDNIDRLGNAAIQRILLDKEMYDTMDFGTLAQDTEAICHAFDETKAGIEMLPARDRVLLARKYLYDALNHQNPDPFGPVDRCSTQLYIFRHQPLYRRMLQLLSIFHMFMSFFEPATNSAEAVLQNDTERQVLVALDGFICFCYLVDLCLELKSAGGGWRRLWVSKWRQAQWTISFLLLIDWVLDLQGFVRWFRPLRSVRNIMQSRALLRTFEAILATTSRWLEFVLILIAFLLFFGLVGLHSFADTYFADSLTMGYHNTTLEQIPSHKRALLPYNFNTLSNSMLAIIPLISGDNWPKLGIPAYLSNPANVLYFVLFAVCCLLVLSVPLSFVFEDYGSHRRKQFFRDRVVERRGLVLSFLVAGGDSTGFLTYETFFKVAETIVPKSKKDELPVFIREVDTKNKGHIDLVAFLLVSELPFWKIHKPKLPHRYLSRLNRCIPFKRIAESTAFTLLCTLVIVFNAVVMGWKTGYDDAEQSQFLAFLDALCTYFFVLEASIKILGLGWKGYWDEAWNKVDFSLVIISVAVLVSDLVAPVGLEANSVKSARLMRLFRLLRVLRVIKVVKGAQVLKLAASLSYCSRVGTRVDGLMGTLVAVLPTAAYTCWILVCIFYFFAIIGQEYFALGFEQLLYENRARLNRVPGSLSKLQSDYGTFGLNPMYGYTTMSLSLLTLFQTFMSANWLDVVLDCHEATKHRPGSWAFTWFFHCFFYLVTVLIITNLITALVWQMLSAIDRVAQNEEEQKSQEARLQELAEETTKAVDANSEGANRNGSEKNTRRRSIFKKSAPDTTPRPGQVIRGKSAHDLERKVFQLSARDKEKQLSKMVEENAKKVDIRQSIRDGENVINFSRISFSASPNKRAGRPSVSFFNESEEESLKKDSVALMAEREEV
eukprot:CAMPEP_0175166794 /NCGR_PEP_ID=MMETSP0087-20121206/27925_1 /TAXON_ID=136419 /ORGANISM="Unknown Unknown, Strain D1" /LENGTH=1070 /DNA_ID=CAMNT_0016456493 /DNA_START=186 /DNA_END=3398 /DNA_ORIENTATION=-